MMRFLECIPFMCKVSMLGMNKCVEQVARFITMATWRTYSVLAKPSDRLHGMLATKQEFAANGLCGRSE